MKRCKKCLHWKPVEEFYKQPGAADGLKADCKACYRFQVNVNREAKRKQYRAYDKARAKLPHRKQAQVDAQRMRRFWKRKRQGRME